MTNTAMALDIRCIFDLDGEKDRVFLVGDWPQEIMITEQVLVQADPRYVRTGDGLIDFTLDNASAVYGITRHDAYREVYHAVLLEVR